MAASTARLRREGHRAADAQVGHKVVTAINTLTGKDTPMTPPITDSVPPERLAWRHPLPTERSNRPRILPCAHEILAHAVLQVRHYTCCNTTRPHG